MRKINLVFSVWTYVTFIKLAFKSLSMPLYEFSPLKQKLKVFRPCLIPALRHPSSALLIHPYMQPSFSLTEWHLSLFPSLTAHTSLSLSLGLCLMLSGHKPHHLLFINLRFGEVFRFHLIFVHYLSWFRNKVPGSRTEHT